MKFIKTRKSMNADVWITTDKQNEQKTKKFIRNPDFRKFFTINHINEL